MIYTSPQGTGVMQHSRVHHRHWKKIDKANNRYAWNCNASLLLIHASQKEAVLDDAKNWAELELCSTAQITYQARHWATNTRSRCGLNQPYYKTDDTSLQRQWHPNSKPWFWSHNFPLQGWFLIIKCNKHNNNTIKIYQLQHIKTQSWPSTNYTTIIRIT